MSWAAKLRNIPIMATRDTLLPLTPKALGAHHGLEPAGCTCPGKMPSPPCLSLCRLGHQD